MEIALTQGKVAHIDDEDWPLVRPFKWYAHHDQEGRWYAQTNVWCPARRKRVTLAMHALIAGARPGDMVDHRDPAATLDNRRRNIRVCTNAQDQQNIGPRGGGLRIEGRLVEQPEGSLEGRLPMRREVPFRRLLPRRRGGGAGLRLGHPAPRRGICPPELPEGRIASGTERRTFGILGYQPPSRIGTADWYRAIWYRFQGFCS